MNAVRGCSSRSAIVMHLESSMRMPRKFCCGTAAFRIKDGRNKQNVSSARSARRNATSTARSRFGPSVVTPRYVTRAADATTTRPNRPIVADREAANVKSPCWKTNAGYLKKNLKSQPTSRHSTQVVSATSHVSSRDSTRKIFESDYTYDSRARDQAGFGDLSLLPRPSPCENTRRDDKSGQARRN